MVSISSHLKEVASVAMPDLKALFWVQTVRLRTWKVVSFVLDGIKDRDSILYALRKVTFITNIAAEVENDRRNPRWTDRQVDGQTEKKVL